MFYSNQILARKGPLGLVWIAAHMEGRLKRQQINSTSIPASVDTLLDPEVPLALRLSGQLLLGVVRIYARKVAYLQQDCDAALVKIRVALRPADNCNLPPGSQVAPVEAITLLDPAAAAATRKARAAAAAAAVNKADGRNNNATAAAVDGWLGPVDEDGLMLGLDDLAWDEEVLLGEGAGGGFGLGGGLRFEPNTRLSFGMTPSKSGLGSQDISGVFGMYSSQDEMQETFDLEDEEAAAVWDLDEFEVEKLRAAPVNSQRDSGIMSGLLGGDETLAGGKGHAAGEVEGSLSAGGPLGDDGFTPGSLPAQDEGNRDLQEDAGQQQQHDPYDLDLDLGNLEDMLPPTPAAADEQAADADADAAAAAAAAAGMDVDAQQEQEQPAAAAAAAAAATKTFVRRNARQQGKEVDEGGEGKGDAAAAGEGEGAGGKERVAPMTAAKSARRRRVSGLLGLKRRVMVDVGEEPFADGRGSTARHTTELPAAEIRALLADRAPLLDMGRVHKVSKLLQQQAASSLTAQGAAAVAQRQLQTIAAAAAAAGAPAGSHQTAVAAAAAAAAEVVAAAGAGAARAGAHRLPGAAPGLGLASLSAGFAGGMGLPAELQQLFSKAAAAAPAAAGGPAAGLGGAAAAAGGGEAGAVAPTAPLEEIGGFGDELDEDLEGFAAAGALNPGLAGGGGTRCSLSMSLTRTPGSAAGSLPQHPTPGTDAATAGAGGAGFGATPGSAGFTPGMQGYTPGYTPGSGPNPDLQLDADAGDVLQPLDEGNMGQYGQEGAGLGGVDSLLPGGWEGLDGEGKENALALGKASGRMVWPADAETLLEQEAADHEAPVGSFTARTRLVVRHLQHAAAAAGGGAVGGPGMTPTSIGSKRRISAAAAGLATGPAGGKGAEGAGAAAAFEGPVLSFDGITRGHSRLDACRWFYETLVLSNRGLVQLQQDESYGDIRVTPNLASMARV